MNTSSVNWYQIPVTDMERAVRFYEDVFSTTLNRQGCVGPLDMSIFPIDRTGDGVTGSLVAGPGCVPSQQGAVVYLNAEAGVDAILARVRDAGGDILLPKTALPAPAVGFFAHIADTEGNRVGVHSYA